MTTLNILDDHKMVVNSLSRMINDSGTARVTDAYYDIKSCREGLEKAIPDILLLDIGLPDGDGVDFCAEIEILKRYFLIYETVHFLKKHCFGKKTA